LGWITDLTAADPYFVLPILMGVAMYGQQAITPQAMDGMQAKMMKYFMPVMFTVMMLWLPSGLTLYIFVNTVLSMLHQVYMNRTDPDYRAGLRAKGGGSPGSNSVGAQQPAARPRPRAEANGGASEDGDGGEAAEAQDRRSKKRRRKSRK
jgi:membrane protein insertase Oxa1/YidC/SpoIIIJ